MSMQKEYYFRPWITRFCFLVLFSSLLTVTINSEEVFAETISISILSGTSAPGCETSANCFHPSGLLVEKGTTVKWINKDSSPHTITSGTSANGNNGLFDSGLIMASYDFSHKFTKTGNYDYFCNIHPWMEGNIIVYEIPEEDEEIETANTFSPSNEFSAKTSSNNQNNDDSRIITTLSNRIEVMNDEIQNLKSQLKSEKIRADMMAVDKAQLSIMYDELETESDHMRQTISEQKDMISELKDETKSLKALVMEQLSVLNNLFSKLNS